MTPEPTDPNATTPEPAPEPTPERSITPPSSLPFPPEVVEKVDREQIRHFVTTIKTAEQQVGEHIVGALKYNDTVAVLTTVVIGPDGSQRVVSAGLDPAMMHEVQKALATAEVERTEEIPCVGFHCFLKPKTKDTT